MGLSADVRQQLQGLVASGTVPPVTVQASDSQGLTLRVEMTAIERLACAFSELSLFVPQLQNCPFDLLQRWADDLSRRITYLLENIGPLEVDPTAGNVLIRSTPPQQAPSGTQYYEVMLSSAGSGTFTMQRFLSVAGQPGRTAVEIQVTYEVLGRLIDDLLATIPTVP